MNVRNVVFGNVIVTEPKDVYLARVAGVEGCASRTST